MSRRDPVDRVIDLAFGVPIAATAFAREATRLALHAIVEAGSPRSRAPDRPGDGDPKGPDEHDELGTVVEFDIEPAPDVPFDGYDSMDAREVLVLLESLDENTLELVEVYERHTRGRRTVLARVAALRQPNGS